MNAAARATRRFVRAVRQLRRWRVRPAAATTLDGVPVTVEPAPRPRAPTPVPMLTQRRFVTHLPVPDGVPPLPPLVVEAAPEHYVPKRLEEVGLAGYEPDTLAAWCAALQRRPEGLVYDIGANIGVFSLIATLMVREGLAPAHDVVAVEPTPELVELSRRLQRRNGLEFEVLPVCFGAEDGTATFHLSDQSDASSSLNARFRPSSRKLEVPVVRLDSRELGRTPTLLKIDTETTEPDVLRGATETLRRHRPWVICEVLPDRGVEAALQPIVDGLGYHAYRLDEEPRIERSLDGDATYEYLNWLFTPEPPDDGFWAAAARWRAALG